MDFYEGFYSDETYLEHFYCDGDDFALTDVFQFILDKNH